jgi:IS5 family transposase
LLVLPDELGRVDRLLDDPAFFAPFAPHFDPRIGRPSTPMETYLRLMFLKFRYRPGYESLCREVADSITWRRFCRIPLDGQVPHPTTLMKLSTRCGSAAVDGCNEALLAKAAQAKLLRTTRLRADTTVVPANVCYPTDSGLLAKAVRRIAATERRTQAAGGAVRTKVRDRSRAAGKRAHDLGSKLKLRTVFLEGATTASASAYTPRCGHAGGEAWSWRTSTSASVLELRDLYVVGHDHRSIRGPPYLILGGPRPRSRTSRRPAIRS